MATVLYVHGNGNKVRKDRLKLDWDRALFGRDMGDKSVMAYWASLRYPEPLPDGEFDEIDQHPAGAEGPGEESVGGSTVDPVEESSHQSLFDSTFVIVQRASVVLPCGSRRSVIPFSTKVSKFAPSSCRYGWSSHLAGTGSSSSSGSATAAPTTICARCCRNARSSCSSGRSTRTRTASPMRRI